MTSRTSFDGGGVPVTAILERGPIADLVADARYDEALDRLHQAQQARGSDAELGRAIRTVRDRALRHGLDRLGSLDAVPGRTRAVASGLEADPAYVFDLIEGTTTIDELLDRSTLGRHRTVRALVALLDRGAIETKNRATGSASALRSGTASHASASSTAVSSTAGPPTGVKYVIVADGNAPQAALTRTMMRLALGAGVRFDTVQSSSDVVAAVERQRPDLLIVEFTLPGGDGLEALRSVRRPGGTPIPSVLVAQRVQIDYVGARAPDRSVMLARPIEKAALHDALGALGVASARART
jgi:CheY-like chemotaxis protein